MPPSHPPPPPPLDGVLETVLYYAPAEEGEVRRFYEAVLGMRPIGGSPGRFLFYRAGRSVFLLFNREFSLGQEDPPPHGASGPGHTCFLVPGGLYAEWKDHLARNQVAIEREAGWPGGGRSFYFRDPAGNALEVADRDIWPGK